MSEGLLLSFVGIGCRMRVWCVGCGFDVSDADARRDCSFLFTHYSFLFISLSLSFLTPTPLFSFPIL